MKCKLHDGNGHRVPTLNISGKIAPEEEQSLRRAVRALLDRGHQKILLDLGDLTEIDSRGINSLFSCCSEAQNEGAEITLRWSH